MDRWLALLCLGTVICQLRVTVRALSTVAEACSGGPDLCVATVAISVSISETLENSGWVESLVISTTELVGELRPGQMKLKAVGPFLGEVRHGFPPWSWWAALICPAISSTIAGPTGSPRRSHPSIGAASTPK